MSVHKTIEKIEDFHAINLNGRKTLLNKYRPIIMLHYIYRILVKSRTICKKYKRNVELQKVDEYMKYLDAHRPAKIFYKSDDYPKETVIDFNVVDSYSSSFNYIFAEHLHSKMKKKVDKKLVESVKERNEKYFSENFDTLIEDIKLPIDLSSLKEYIGDKSISDSDKEKIWVYFEKILSILK